MLSLIVRVLHVTANLDSSVKMELPRTAVRIA
jgi:hypothetical protein